MAQSKEQLRRLRQKYHLGEYSHKKGRTARRHRARHARGGFTARHRVSHRRGFGGGMIKPIVGGAVGSFVTPYIPVANQLPYSNVIGGAAGGYMMQKSMNGALIGAVSGFVTSLFLKGGSGANYSGGY